MAHNRKQAGFTIVELLIVIVVIGILAALVITTFTGIQAKARDTERTTDIKAIHGQLEAYYAQKGYYPSLDDVNNVTTGTWVADNLKGLDAGALRDPQGTVSTFAAAAASHRYSYTTTPGNCAGTEASPCTSYVLTATLDNGTSTFTKNSLN